MQYHSPGTFDEAISLAKNTDGVVRFLAGGTDVLVQLRSDLVTPNVLIDLKKINGAKDIVKTKNSWTIGLAVSGAEISEHLELQREWPGVVEAMDLIGSTQVQGRATLAGNLCNGSPAADSVPAMVAARASVNIVGPNGERNVAVQNIPVGPGRTSLEKGEMIASVNIPRARECEADAYLRFIPRTEMDIAVVGCGVNLMLDGGVVADARVSLGAVAPTVLRVEEAANAIIGTKLEESALHKLAAAASAACNPIDDKRGTIKFRTHIAGVLAGRAAKIAYDRALNRKA